MLGLVLGAAVYAETGGPPMQPAASPSPSVLSQWPSGVLARIEKEMQDAASRVAPGAQVVDAQGVEKRRVNAVTGIAERDHHSITATVRLEGRAGKIWMQGMPLTDGSFDYYRCKHTRGDCEEVTTPDGLLMVVETRTMPRDHDPNPEISYRVTAERTDGMAVNVWLTNRSGDQPNSDAPPLTLEQIKQVALDPALVL